MADIPLLVARRGSGRGPWVPVRGKFQKLRVEGLSAGESIKVHTAEHVFDFSDNGEYTINVLPDEKVKAELCGPTSCVYVWLCE